MVAQTPIVVSLDIASPQIVASPSDPPAAGGLVVALSHVPGLLIPAGSIAVPSASSPGRWWLVGEAGCSCPAGAHGRRCWHRDAARALAPGLGLAQFARVPGVPGSARVQPPPPAAGGNGQNTLAPVAARLGPLPVPVAPTRVAARASTASSWPSPASRASERSPAEGPVAAAPSGGNGQPAGQPAGQQPAPRVVAPIPPHAAQGRRFPIVGCACIHCEQLAKSGQPRVREIASLEDLF